MGYSEAICIVSRQAGHLELLVCCVETARDETRSQILHKAAQTPRFVGSRRLLRIAFARPISWPSKRRYDHPLEACSFSSITKATCLQRPSLTDSGHHLESCKSSAIAHQASPVNMSALGLPLRQPQTPPLFGLTQCIIGCPIRCNC